MLLLAILASPIALEGHAELLRSEPASASILTAVPPSVRLWFSEPVDPPADAVTVTGPDGERVDRRDSRNVADDDRALDVSVRGQARGTYTVRWHAISADSHPISGTFQFSVGGGEAGSAAGGAEDTAGALVAQPSQRSAGVLLQATARWLHLVGLALLAGPPVLLTLMGARVRVDGVERRLWQCSRWGAVVLLPVTLLSLVAQSAAVSGSLAEGLQPAALMSLLDTQWSTLWTVRATLVAAIVAMTSIATAQASRHRPARAWHAAVLVSSGALLVVTAMNGHSAATAPVWLSLGVDWLHLAATVVWIGGLFSLSAVLLPAARRLGLDEHRLVLASVVPRFSTTALVSVQLLVLTGVYHLLAHVSDWNALVSTGYGQTLLVKLALIGVMLLPAAFHLLVVKRRLATDRLSMARAELGLLQRTVGVEAGVGILVLAVVGLLTSLPPARSVEAGSAQASAGVSVAPSTDVADRPALTLSAPAGSSIVTLILGPGRVGSNRVEVLIRDASGTIVNNAQVRFRIVAPADSQIAPWVVVPARRGERHQATVSLAPEGNWSIAVAVAQEATPTATAVFSVTVPVPD